jgi:hypothetical protein
MCTASTHFQFLVSTEEGVGCPIRKKANPKQVILLVGLRRDWLSN